MIVAYRRTYRHLLLLPALVFLIVWALPALGAATPQGKAFPSPEKAAAALAAALRNVDRGEVSSILGPGSNEIVSSGDEVVDKEGKERFLRLYDERHRIDKSGAKKATLVVGEQEYPFPIPLIKSGKGWLFDSKAGKDEILNRRIGRDELAVIDVLRAYVEAQRDYASRDPNRQGIAQFAQKIRSTPGKKDGLYWKAAAGEEESPLGPLAAKAATEGYSKPETEEPVPYHGYYFKILKAQGKNAPGGAYDYVANGRMVLGFAMVAYPAQYGSSGVMTFIVNQDGTVYQKNLGKDTEKLASAMTAYDPDKSWKRVEENR